MVAPFSNVYRVKELPLFDCIHIDVWKLRLLHLATYNALGIPWLSLSFYKPGLDRSEAFTMLVFGPYERKRQGDLLHASHTPQEHHRPAQWLTLTRLPVNTPITSYHLRNLCIILGKACRNPSYYRW